eukprot:2087153-Pleurochrysis_carterae.AAC.1
MAQTMVQLRKRIAVLEQKASEAGLAHGTAAAPSASTSHVEDERGHVVVAPQQVRLISRAYFPERLCHARADAGRSRPTSGAGAKDELGDAVSRRIGILKRQ